jgi:hypothetical protein
MLQLSFVFILVTVSPGGNFLFGTRSVSLFHRCSGIIGTKSFAFKLGEPAGPI